MFAFWMRLEYHLNFEAKLDQSGENQNKVRNIWRMKSVIFGSVNLQFKV